MRFPLAVFFLLVATGCASSASARQDDVPRDNPQEATRTALHATIEDHALSLDGSAVQEKRIADFLKTKNTFSELDKIYYLLSAIRDSKATFVRNGDQFTGDKASSWLRWKIRHRQYKSNPIVTGRDFVDRVCLQSNKTGVPYEVILADGRRKRLKEVMNDELIKLEAAIREKVVTDLAKDAKASDSLGEAHQGAPIPALVTAGAK